MVNEIHSRRPLDPRSITPCGNVLRWKWSRRVVRNLKQTRCFGTGHDPRDILDRRRGSRWRSRKGRRHIPSLRNRPTTGVYSSGHSTVKVVERLTNGASQRSSKERQWRLDVMVLSKVFQWTLVLLCEDECVSFSDQLESVRGEWVCLKEKVVKETQGVGE